MSDKQYCGENINKCRFCRQALSKGYVGLAGLPQYFQAGNDKWDGSAHLILFGAFAMVSSPFYQAGYFGRERERQKRPRGQITSANEEG